MEPRTIQQRLRSIGDADAATKAAGFFKTGPGGYSEGDKFVGVPVPALRRLVREFAPLELSEVDVLLRSAIHEERLLALLFLVALVAKKDQAKKKEVFDFYLRRTKHINNWDLVDSSAPAIVGGYLFDRDRPPYIGWPSPRARGSAASLLSPPSTSSGRATWPTP
jgi:hypothetical protein